MLEFAHVAGSALPRVWGVNHHPEIGDVGLQRERLQRLWENGGADRGLVQGAPERARRVERVGGGRARAPEDDVLDVRAAAPPPHRADLRREGVGLELPVQVAVDPCGWWSAPFTS